MKRVWISGAALAVSLIILMLMPRPVSAQDAPMQLWVTPEGKDSDTVGNWPVSKKGDVRFGFQIPPNLRQFAGATVVVIPRRSGTVRYDLDISMARNGLPSDLFNQSSKGMSIAVQKGVITEIDVTSIFPAGSSLAPGQDFVGLRFNSAGSTKNKSGKSNKSSKKGSSTWLQVVGLRFDYEGPAGPEGEKGDRGDKGDPGESGGGTSAWTEGSIMFTPPPQAFLSEQQGSFSTTQTRTLDQNGSVLWQSFSPSVTGTLIKLDLAVGAFKGASGEDYFCGDLSVFAGEGPVGAALGTLAIKIGAGDVAFPMMLGFPVAGVTLTAGETFTWALTHTGCAHAVVAYGTGNSYAAGTSSVGADVDFAFRSFVSVAVAPIPLRSMLTTDLAVGIGTDDPRPDAMLDVNGRIYQRGGQLHADYVFQPGYRIETITEHSDAMWANRHLPAVGPATKDSDGQDIVDVGRHQRGILEELEKAHIYIQWLHERLVELENKQQERHR